jgi:hypothetical protein
MAITFDLSRYIDDLNEDYEFYLDRVENSEAYEVNQFSSFLSEYIFLPLSENLDQSNSNAYNIFYRAIFKEFSTEENYSLTTTKPDSKFSLSKFDKSNGFYKFLKDYMCRRVIQPIGQRIITSQCYYRDDPLNIVLSNIDVKNYHNLFPSLNRESFDKDYSSTSNSIFSGFNYRDTVFTLTSFESELIDAFESVPDYRSYIRNHVDHRLGTQFLKEDVIGSESMSSSLYKALKGKNFFVIFLRVRFEV